MDGPHARARAAAGGGAAGPEPLHWPAAGGRQEVLGLKVAVLMGGRSSEREISLRTGRGIAQSLRNLGHEVASVDAANGRLLPAGDEERGALPSAALEPAGETALARPETLRDADVVFIALHGAAGENGTLQ